ncbi:MAG: ArsR family transcriptional regulator [Planctomycetaceae bacterium]|nr:ArsR family transcriptional regulator [Planctomycetaceae bacterium]
MSSPNESSVTDGAVIDWLRRQQTGTVHSLAERFGVTATAMRQRLVRLMDEGLIERHSEAAGRGRPTHWYRLTPAGWKSGGNNYEELAVALWQEIRAVGDPEIRRGLLQRIATRLAEQFQGKISGESAEERLASLAMLMAEKQIPVEVDHQGGLPVIHALACPFPDLAEHDRGVCAVEKMVFSELVGDGVTLSACRLDGADCCSFTPGEPVEDT